MVCRLFLALVTACCLSTVVRADDFWTYWGDGKAELDGYELTQPRYGHPRKGKAVMIFVTEEHSPKERVKIEGHTSAIPSPGKIPIFKLNFVRTFQTGIYDYKILESVFARLDKSLQPAKISVSVQEWCGHVYHQVLVRDHSVEETLHSYFGGEADQANRLRLDGKAIFEDDIPILIRELKGPWLNAGSTLETTCGPSLLALRLLHKPFAWKTIQITKSSVGELIQTALGKIPVTHWKIVTPYSGTFTYLVEASWPHRIVEWESDQGESGKLLGSARLPYWKLHDPGDEKYLKELGF